MYCFKGRKVGQATGTGIDFHGYGDAIRRDYLSALPAEAPRRVLDIGTGFGLNIQLLAERYPDSEIWTIDPAHDPLIDARRTLGNRRHCIGFGQGDAQQLPYQDHAFDLTTSVMVLHHVLDAQQALHEMARVTRPGGRLIVLDWQPAAHRLPFPPGTHARRDFVPIQRLARWLRHSDLRCGMRKRRLWYMFSVAKVR